MAYLDPMVTMGYHEKPFPLDIKYLTMTPLNSIGVSWDNHGYSLITLGVTKTGKIPQGFFFVRDCMVKF